MLLKDATGLSARKLESCQPKFCEQEQGFVVGKKDPVQRQQPAVADVDRELDDALSTVWLVRGNDALSTRLFDQVVDLLLERILLELRTELVAGRLSAADFANQLATLADQCRSVGLLSSDAS